MTRWLLLVGMLLLAPSLVAAPSDAAPGLGTILAGMARQKQRQQDRLRAYEARRRFEAANRRFKAEAHLEVETLFRRGEPLESRVVRASGSQLIHRRVFGKILKTERDASDRKSREEIDIGPANYDFELAGVEEVGGRRAYRLKLAPRRKSPFLIAGSAWVDAEDFGIARVAGSPSKRPSFWTLRTTVERTYTRIDGVWLPQRTDSVSDVLVVGRSTLEIRVEYRRVDAEP